MKTEFSSFLYKQKKTKLKKLLFNDETNNKISNKKINLKKGKDNVNLLNTDKNNENQKSVIHKFDIEKFKNSFKTLKNSYNIANSEDNSKIYNHLKETKENIPFNGLNRGLLSTKSKKINSSLNKYMNKRDLYHTNNSCIKKFNLKGFNNCNNNIHNNRYNNLEININLGSKNRTVLKNLSNSNCKNINNELKTKKNLKSFILNYELNKNAIMKNNNNKTNKNIASSHNFVHNYNTQKNASLKNNLLHSTNFNLKDSKTTTINDFNEKNIFNYNEEKQVELTKDEKMLYGDRIMKGYTKIKLLGKGGYGIVWLCNKNLNSNENDMNCYAIKQTSKKKNPEISHNLNNISIARNEIAVLNILNNNIANGIELNSSDDDNNNNCELIPKIYDSYEDNNDIWLSFEKGGISLSNLCFKIKGEFEKGERIYLIQKGQFLEYLFSDINHFKHLLKQLVIGINYINNKGIIHSDIKPENILIDFSQKGDCFKINSIKIIDYGSAFLYNEISSSTTSNTPEYLCPEITVGNKKFIKDLSNNIKYINAVDIWSLGITFLELCLCCPIWMNFKSKITMKGKKIYTHGIFGCRMRDSNKIYQKQVEVSKNLKKLLNNSLLYMFEKEDRDNFIDLLGKMLNIDYNKRISSQNILKHPFLNNSIE